MSHTTRRDFAKLALAALPAAGLFSVLNRAQAAEVAKGSRPKPNSKVNGVQIGLNVPIASAAAPCRPMKSSATACSSA